MTIAIGSQITAADVNNLTKIVRKTANETVNNSIAWQNDDDLFFAMAANEVWVGKLMLRYESTAVADFKGKFVDPVGSVFNIHTVALHADGVTLTSFYTQDVYITGYGAIAGLVIPFLVINGVNAGNFQFQWAQNTAEASNTIVYQESCIVAHRVLPAVA